MGGITLAYMKFKVKKSNQMIVCSLAVMLMQAIYIIFYAFFPSIEETHYLVTMNDDMFGNTDIVNQIYDILRTPVYTLMDPIFSNPYMFAIFSYMGDMLFPLILFLTAYGLTNNSTSSLLSVLLFSPLMQNFLIKIIGFSLIPSWIHFGWGSVIISVRMLFGIISILLIYNYIKGRYYFSYILLLLIFFIHPNNGIIITCMIFIASFYLYAYETKSFNKVILVFIVGIIGVIPSMFKLIAINEISLEVNISNIDWYANMIRDESDDFSLIYQVLYNIKGIIVFFIVTLLTVYLAIKIGIKNKSTNLLILFVLTPWILFLFLFLLEYVSLYSGNYFAISTVISFQAGDKLLSYSLIPMIFLWGIIISYILDKVIQSRIFPFFILGGASAIMLIVIFTRYNIFSKQSQYIEALSSIDLDNQSYAKTLIVKSKISLLDNNPSIYPIYHNIKYDCWGELNLFVTKRCENVLPKLELDLEYNKKYNTTLVFDSLIFAILENVPVGRGLIIPPYLAHMRDALPAYDIYFQEHHDGNLMMGNKIIASIMLGRMRDLLGIDYTELPTHVSGYNYTYMRELYLNIKKANLIKIKNKSPNYKYFITESSRTYTLPIIYKDEYYVIYKIEGF
jgi:hypothetical protein